MSPDRKNLRDWIVPKKPVRLLVLFAVVVGIFGTDCWRRRWRADTEISTEHYVVYSTATPEHTEKIATVVEMLYDVYSDTFSETADFKKDHAKLKLKLFKDRDEFRRCNPRIGWAEAFYLHPHCYAYYPDEEMSPYHWMVHEAVHQLNREVAGFKLAKWADEGVAEYFGTSEIRRDKMYLGKIDSHTYPIWWLGGMKLTGDIAKDIQTNRIIPLTAIISGKGGPDIDEHFNLYYIHWWSLSHFLFEYDNGKYKGDYFKVIKEGATPESFEKHVGPIPDIQKQWYEYLCDVAKKY